VGAILTANEEEHQEDSPGGAGVPAGWYWRAEVRPVVYAVAVVTRGKVSARGSVRQSVLGRACRGGSTAHYVPEFLPAARRVLGACLLHREETG